MKKILLGTSAILGALTLVASSANAQTASMMKDQKAGMKASIGGTVGATIQGSDSAGTQLALPSWRNYISVKADGQASTLNMTYGAYLRYRPFDGADGADKAYVYFGQKYFGKVTIGRDNTVVTNNKISSSGIVPGYSQDGESIANSQYNWDSLDLVASAKPLGVSYETPSIYGVKLGYSFSSGQTTANGAKRATGALPLGPTHSAVARYDNAFGPVTLAVAFGGLYSNQGNGSTTVDASGYTAGAQVGYTDGKNIGVTVNGAYHNLHNDTAKVNAFSTWEVGVAFDTPRVAGLTLGMLFAQSSRAGAESDNHFGVGLGYAWSENFNQTLGYDTNFTDKGYSWVLASQVSF